MKQRILIVDDSPLVQKMYGSMLKKSGFEVDYADRLSIGLSRIAEGGIDAVLLDLTLPDTRGIDTFLTMHAQAPGVPIVVLSGQDDEKVSIGAVQSGAQDYLVKGPVDINLLTRSVRYAIERKRSEENLHHLATHDVLTELPNRTLFYDRLGMALDRAPWRKGLLAVMFIDLDHFKRINDTLGHDVGDLLLQAVAERLITCVRKGDTVARLGGDEFSILLSDVGQADDVSMVSQKILNVLSKPFVLKGHELFITPSIGVSLYPNDGETSSELLKKADVAMYHAKEQGRGNFQHFSESMNIRASERFMMEKDLRYALEREQFILHYQPHIDLKTGQIHGMEALLYWQHPERGLILPDKFTSLLEESGLIIPIGEWVLRAALGQSKAWQIADLPLICVAVKLLPRQLQQQNLIDTVNQGLTETRQDPKYLELVVTESILMGKEEAYATMFHEMNALGIHLSIADFGAGYTSFSNLKRLPIDSLKIDQSFVKNITLNQKDAAITAAIIQLAQSLGLKTIAEGVETTEQMECLRSLRCDRIQGNLVSQPLPPEEATKLLAEKRCL